MRLKKFTMKRAKTVEVHLRHLSDSHLTGFAVLDASFTQGEDSQLSSTEGCVSKSMEELAFVKCEPEWLTDIKEEPSDFELNAIPYSENELNIKEDPWPVVANQLSEEVDIKLIKEPCTDKDEIGDVRNEVCENSGGTSHKYLATGDSYQTIAFSFRVGRSTVSTIIKEVCK
ncbi:uncharacterized protein [Anabrus simplex]|uniref:uncharacterized protein isoform X2 n=1 Tax=Anabrus simplex TaxID=316456 RepID=UPI0035A346F3